LNWLLANPISGFGFTKMFSEKLEKGVKRSTRWVLPWHGGGSEYLEGTAKGFEVVMFD
jgi:hypothetical protein